MASSRSVDGHAEWLLHRSVLRLASIALWLAGGVECESERSSREAARIGFHSYGGRYVHKPRNVRFGQRNHALGLGAKRGADLQDAKRPRRSGADSRVSKWFVPVSAARLGSLHQFSRPSGYSSELSFVVLLRLVVERVE